MIKCFFDKTTWLYILTGFNLLCLHNFFFGFDLKSCSFYHCNCSKKISSDNPSTFNQHFNPKRLLKEKNNTFLNTAHVIDNVNKDVSQFCPQGHFTGNDEKYDVGNGVTLCGDQIIYGYDLMFERQSLFSLNTWLGVPNQQDPIDAMIIAELIQQEKPDLIIELGTNEGGGALFYASIMELINHGNVITIDPNHFKNGGWIKNPRCSKIKCDAADSNYIWNKRVTFILGTPPHVIDEVEKLSKNANNIWLIEDSSHGYDMVLSNLNSYAHLVSKGGLLQVQDTKLSRFVCGLEGCSHKSGPLDAVNDFLKDHSNEFVMDRSLEYYRYTQHAKGWLRKINS